jgi:hypothetical protein
MFCVEIVKQSRQLRLDELFMSLNGGCLIVCLILQNCFMYVYSVAINPNTPSPKEIPILPTKKKRYISKTTKCLLYQSKEEFPTK